MAEQNQSEIQNGAGTQPSYRDSHAAAAIDIQSRLRTVGADDDARRFVDEELAKPVDLYAITAEVRDAATAAEVYAASLAAIQVDTEAERQYLDNLALRLGLDRGTVDGLHRRLASSTTT